MKLFVDFFISPIGFVSIKATENHITEIIFVEKEPILTSPSDLTTECKNQLLDYFSGKRKKFTIPLFAEGTEFQKRVWNKLLEIPYGETISYFELAHRLGNAKVIRAAGHANGQNPISIIIPCHRVIGKNGKLVGYGGGLHRKEWLLKHELQVSSEDHFFKL